jgi:hypothetical protein
MRSSPLHTFPCRELCCHPPLPKVDAGKDRVRISGRGANRACNVARGAPVTLARSAPILNAARDDGLLIAEL